MGQSNGIARVAFLFMAAMNGNFVYADSAATQCVFSAEAFSAKTYQLRAKVAYVMWIPAAHRAAIVSRSGHLVAIRHWSCTHLGAEAYMYLDTSGGEEPKINDAMIELAMITLPLKDAEFVRPLIEQHLFGSDHEDRLDFSNQVYDEFYASVERAGPKILLLTLKYYRD